MIIFLKKNFSFRLHVACDTTFLYWEKNSFTLYLQDLFLTVRDPHRLHVRKKFHRWNALFNQYCHSLVHVRCTSRLCSFSACRSSWETRKSDQELQSRCYENIRSGKYDLDLVQIFVCLSVFSSRIIQSHWRRSSMSMSRTSTSGWS